MSIPLPTLEDAARWLLKVIAALIVAYTLIQFGAYRQARYTLDVAQSVQDVRYLKGIVAGQLRSSADLTDRAIWAVYGRDTLLVRVLGQIEIGSFVQPTREVE